MKFRSDSKVGKHFAQIARLYYYGFSTKEIGKLFDIDPSNIYRALRSAGVKLRTKSEALKNAIEKGVAKRLSGADHPKWKGGISHHSTGYVLIKKPEHPKSNVSGYVFEHVLMAEEKIGRSLLPNEIVHHLNGNIVDNRPENLEVMTNIEHGKIHGPEGAQKRWSGRK